MKIGILTGSAAAVYLVAGTVAGQQATEPWRDPSPHLVHFVDVEPGVRLEVLEWPGEGPHVVLLTGSGNTAHVYDRLAAALEGCCRLYAITRRGFGRSSHPADGYDDQRRSDDILRVIEVLKIPNPVLVGHSLAGGEMTTLGAQHSNLLSGLIYLDAGADPIDSPWNNLTYREGVQKVASMNPAPTSAEQAFQTHRKDSVAAYQRWQTENEGFAFSESEIRSMYEFNPDGSIGAFRAYPNIGRLIDAGAKRRNYTGITVPVLSIFAMPDPPADGWADRSPEYRDTARLVDETLTAILRGFQRQLKESVPSARVLEWPGASHFLFMAHEQEVVKEIRDFVSAAAIQPGPR